MISKNTDNDKILHDLTNSLTVIRTALYNIQEIMPALLDAYKVASQCDPDACPKIQDKHLELLNYSLREVKAESENLKNRFNEFKTNL